MPKKNEKEKLEKIKSAFTFVNAIKVVVWFITLLTLLSTIRIIIRPFLPTPLEYEGSFPDKFCENFETWKNKLLIRHIMLFNKYFSLSWVLVSLSHVFFLLLLLNVRKAIKEPLKPEKLISGYFNWAVSSLLITIVFMTKYITTENMIQISLGILGLTVAIFVLLYYSARIKKNEPEEKK